MSTRLARVVFEVERPEVVGRFWAGVLGWVVAVEGAEMVEVAGVDPEGAEVGLAFVRRGVPRKRGKNRIHLDVGSRSVEHQRRQVDRALALGARPIDIGQGEVPWVVLADPEGNEFCVLEPREQYVDTGAVAAIVVDARDPAGLARFWATAAGWPIVHDEDRLTGIRAATGQGPWLEFLRSTDEPPDHGRLHLDLISFPADDPAEEIARLCAAGAKALPPTDTGAGTVLADPETYRFRLLRSRSD
ncbi:VOC family protein [Nocardia terpenica]|uniref:VOC family protein n=1 Tax=Nocardia terpenica TaxID=455432 RepID=UPI002FE0C557